jgi:hypothetical protein
MFSSQQFTQKLANHMYLNFANDPVTAQPSYNYIISYLLPHDPVIIGKSGVFNPEYWNHINNGNTNIHLFFSGISAQASVQIQISTQGSTYSNITLVVQKLTFIKAYIDSYGVPCEYSHIKQIICSDIEKFITHDDVIQNILDIIEKFNGATDLATDKHILDILITNITTYMYLLAKLPPDYQVNMLSTTADYDVIMEHTLSFFIKLADNLKIPYTIDINNEKILEQLLAMETEQLYTLYKNGFIKCDLITLIKKNNNILDIDCMTLSDDDINTIIDTEHDCAIIIKILKNLERHESPHYTKLLTKTIKYYIDTDPFGLSEFIIQTGYVFKIQFDDDVLHKIYDLCTYDPVLYEILFKSADSYDKLIHIKTCGGNMMLSWFVDNEDIMKKGLPEISFDKLFEKNRFGNYVIENLLTPTTINIFKERPDGAEIIASIAKYNINKDSEVSDINMLLKSSKTPINKFMFMCRTLTSSKLSDVVGELSSSDINKLAASTDDRLNNGLFYITRYHSGILEKYMDIIDDASFASVNMLGETLGMYAMRYNAASYTILENADKITKDHNYIDIQSGSLISYAIKYNTDMFEHIINAPYFNEYSLYVKDSVDMIDHEEIDMARIKTCVNLTNIIVAMGDIASYQLLFERYPTVFNKHINEPFMISSTMYNTLRYALYINPEMASIIIGSVMCTDKYIETFCSYFPDNDFSIIAEIQPASWYKIINSNKFKKITPAQCDEYHYAKKTNLGYIVEHATDNNRKLIQYTQSFDFTTKNVCTICYRAKAVILHTKCGHKMCVGCSLIETKCPMCYTCSSPDTQYYID